LHIPYDLHLNGLQVFVLPIWAIFAPADFGALDERLDAVAELTLAVEVLLLQPAQADDFGIEPMLSR
jgi:hypothetical protein